MNSLEVLLHAPNSLTTGERELICDVRLLTYRCYNCQTAHGAIAGAHLTGEEELVRKVEADFRHANISEKLKALLVIAGKVQKGGKNVTLGDIADARAAGATDT